MDADDAFGVFDPSLVDDLEQIVEEAMDELQHRGQRFTAPQLEQLTRELIAHRVMARAAGGELDPEKLKQHALWGF